MCLYLIVYFISHTIV